MFIRPLPLPQEHILLKFETKFEDNMSRDYCPLAVVSIAFMVLSSIFPSYFIWYPYPPGNIDEKMAHAVTKGKLPCNCTLDFLDDTVGFELPNVKIIKN